MNYEITMKWLAISFILIDEGMHVIGNPIWPSLISEFTDQTIEIR